MIQPTISGPFGSSVFWLLLLLLPEDPAAGEGEASRERFLMEGGRKAHVLMRERGLQARLLIAYPAGNIAAAIWFSRSDEKVPELGIQDARLIPGGEPGRWGAAVTLRAGPGSLRIDRMLFHSIRTVRGFTEGYPQADQEKVDRISRDLKKLPADVLEVLDRRALGRDAFAAWARRLPVGAPDPAAAGALVYSRPALGTGKILEMVLIPPGGSAASFRGTTPTIEIQPGSPGGSTFVVTAMHGEAPAPPIAPEVILSPDGSRQLAALEAKDPALHAAARRALEGLSFLSSEDALLAGSWRFLTYFGRDTLLFTMLMGSHLSVRMWSAALGSVLRRVSPEGRVAHEESVGEYGALEKTIRYLDLREKDPAAAREVLSELERGHFSRHDYHMVDTELLVPLAVARLIEVHPTEARELITSHRDHLVKNLTLVTSLARGPSMQKSQAWPAGLIALREGLDAGDWRDSGEGLARGRFPASVNATLMPAVLEAMAVLAADEGLGLRDALPSPGELAGLREEWKKVHDRFVLEYTAADVGKNKKYLEENQLGVVAPVVAASPMKALALSLDARGTPIPVLHGDGLFLLLAPRPPAVDLEAALGPLTRPFPLGLSTPAGPLVASAVLAPDVQPIFRRANYHGLVIWSWPMVLARQAVGRLRRWDRQDLARRLEEQVRSWGPARLEPEELWSVKALDGRLVRTSFGESLEDVTESNSLQLWSLASLAAVLGP